MAPLIGQLLTPKYALGTAVLSYVISFLGSLLALLCARKMVRTDGTVDFGMLACGAVALGGIGIWSMHFIGMVAYRLPIPIAYDMVLTVVSLVAAIVISGIALYLAGGKRFNAKGWIAGSLLAGLGVCVMHYVGMTAASMVFTAPTPLGAFVVGGSNMGLGVFGISGAVLIFILWVVTGRAMDAPRATARA